MLYLSLSEGPLFIVTNPPLRYYVAEGVRLYSQETWRVVTQTGERNQHINKFTSEWVQALLYSYVQCAILSPTYLFFGVLLGSCNVENQFAHAHSGVGY